MRRLISNGVTLTIDQTAPIKLRESKQMERNLIVATALILGACAVPQDYAPTPGKQQVKSEPDAYLACYKQYGYDNPVLGSLNSGTYKGHEIDDCMAALGWTDINPKRWE